MKRIAAFALAVLLASPARAAPLSAGRGAPDPLEAQARQFVRLALSLGHAYPRVVDAYFGPPELDAPARPLGALQGGLQQLAAALGRDPPSPRRDRLLRKVDSLSALTAVMKAPRALSFDDEARRVYGMAVPQPDAQGQARARAALDRLLPGRGDLIARLAAWRARFTIPEDRRGAVFLRALAECRARTLAHWPLPPDEKLDVVWDAGVPAAWQRYQGHDRSRLEINPAAVADPESALDVACHEAYPGHHAQFLAMAARGVEDTVVILRSPEQVLREGAANYGIALAFPAPARLAFTRDVLFPLAGFDRRDAARFVAVHRLVGDLALSVLPILRDYRDGKLASGDAMAALMLQGLVSSPEALLDFTRDTGAYVIGYTAARDLVRDCVAARSRATGRDSWTVLRAIVAGPDLTALDCPPFAQPMSLHRP
ncbi:MAG TPA: hypothetical protein VGC16_09800 [Rhizomicrobium sp.]